jgi:hypothetical protein
VSISLGSIEDIGTAKMIRRSVDDIIQDTEHGAVHSCRSSMTIVIGRGRQSVMDMNQGDSGLGLNCHDDLNAASG